MRDLQPDEAEYLEHEQANGHQIEADVEREGQQAGRERQAPEELGAGVVVGLIGVKGSLDDLAVRLQEPVPVNRYNQKVNNIQILHSSIYLSHAEKQRRREHIL